MGNEKELGDITQGEQPMTENGTPNFHHRRRVEFVDTDMAGIAHFTSFFRYMEEAEHAFLRSRELSVFTIHEGNKLSWPRVSVGCDYHSPARFSDLVNIDVYVEQLASRAITYRFDIWIEEEAGKRKIATGKTVAVCCQMIEGGIKSIDIPAPIREKLERST